MKRCNLVWWRFIPEVLRFSELFLRNGFPYTCLLPGKVVTNNNDTPVEHVVSAQFSPDSVGQ
jgi:hypothetical protein